ncbi:S8 family serine peptidase [Longirhabdus pacifica]|uniref:S8 family serine peptidase n=1 Tax=Longirhabdus pacifica TaxID=2305227 RepID=UPI001008CB6B|nr:S8 family serine peptidase [Longirhabdus pacifica]
MFKRCLSIISALALIFSLQGMPAQADDLMDFEGSSILSENQIIVKFKESTSQLLKMEALDEIKSQVIMTNEQLGIDVIELEDQTLQEGLASFQNMENVEYAEPIVEYKALFTPNDPLYSSNQYGPQMMNAEQAWDITQSDSSVLVAVIDTGVQDDHPDLIGKVVPGYDFIDNDNDPYDEQGHGTHVSGTVAALTNNGIGVAGTAPNAKILSVRVLNSSGSGSNLGVSQGIVYAADNGADIINLSLGGSSPSSAVEDAVNYAWNKGVVVVAAAGNTPSTRPSYPAYYEKSIAVAATDANDQIAYFSTYGDWVDVAAPGVNVISTQLGGGYVSYSGTSMATPHTAGVAALLAGQGLTHEEIRAKLEGTADKIAGTGQYWTHGRINAYEAVKDDDGGGGPGPDPTIVFEDDFESENGWGMDADGTDTATTGMFERAIPSANDYFGPKQLGVTTSGSYDLVTGATRGSSAGVNDIDSGVTSAKSPAITLPSDGSLSVSFNYYFGHYSNSGSDDFFRFSLVQSDGTKVKLFEELGAGSDQDAAWSTQTIDLSSYKGETIYLLFEAADNGTPSLVEAGVDDVKIEKVDSSSITTEEVID